jgi:hypothetical protein
MSKLGEIRRKGKMWESALNALITMGPQLWDLLHKVTLLRQVARDRLVNVNLALSKDHT